MPAGWLTSAILLGNHRGHVSEVIGKLCARRYSNASSPNRFVNAQGRTPRPGFFSAASIPHRLRNHTPPSLPSTTDRSASVCRARTPPSVAFSSARERRPIKAIELSSSHCRDRRPLPPVDSPPGVVVAVGDSSVVVVVAAGCSGALLLGPVHVLMSSERCAVRYASACSLFGVRGMYGTAQASAAHATNTTSGINIKFVGPHIGQATTRVDRRGLRFGSDGVCVAAGM